MECDLRHDVGHHKCLWITQMCLELVFGKHFNSLCLFYQHVIPFESDSSHMIKNFQSHVICLVHVIS